MKQDANNVDIICVLLARGGSKGIKNKNICPVNGKPLIYYTIKAIQDSKIFSRIILSTDSPVIAKVGEKYGIEVPFIRPQSLASDNAVAADVLVHALKWVEKSDRRYDYVQYIFPTAPLRTGDDIRNAAELLERRKADMVMSVCETDHPAQWVNILPEDHSLKNFVPPEYVNKNRQELPRTYRVNGAIFLAKWEIFYNKLNWFEQNNYAYIMPRERSVDIDHPMDLKVVEYLLQDQLHNQ